MFAVNCFAAESIEATYELPFIGNVTADDVHVRAGYHTNFESLGKLDKNTKVLVLERSFHWYKIHTPVDSLCFVNKEFIEAKGLKGKVTVDRLNIRAKAAPNSSILGQLAKDEEVLIIRELPQWYQIRPTEKCFAWVFADFIEYTGSKQDYYAEKQKQQAEFQAELDEGSECFSSPPHPEERSDEGSKEGQASEENPPLAKGILEEVGRLFFKPGSHKIVEEGQTVCYLKSKTLKLDDYLDTEVRIWGEAVRSRSKYHPTFEVTKIERVNENN